MKRVPRPVFFIVSILIVVLTLLSLFGFKTTYGDKETVYIKGGNDIRWGIDIRGGVDVTFTPPEGVEATEAQMDAAKEVINSRLISLNITDSEVYVDYTHYRIIVRFPWKSDETDFDPQQAIDEIGTTAEMVFRKGSTADGEEILTGDDVQSATAGYDQTQGYVVQLSFTSAGTEKFSAATTELAPDNGVISIWLDDENISTATVQSAITDGNAIINTMQQLAGAIGTVFVSTVVASAQAADPSHMAAATATGTQQAFLLVVAFAAAEAVCTVIIFGVFKNRKRAV